MSNQDLSNGLNDETLPLMNAPQQPIVEHQAVYDYTSGTPTTKAPPIKVGNNRVKELVQSRQLKIPEPIRAIEGSHGFDIQQVMALEVTLPLGQLLNESQQLRKEFAFSLQSSAPKYRVKRATKEPVMARAACGSSR
ncbi:MAG: hypothetical protein FRX48_09171 [Lasallia pustulata]|uniref:Uncharacterized protein n=1 Tax=Lasallia pustulata TaxID=136370 RepID=A0A5M8PD13_9LECA|nr:MAG: hypothetical protein FRX48_09853 [Lasallia pustulata]KAA6407105.1 MAG: hypothetical protein FRX48_09171 [Lasallia pustulata]